MKVRAATRCDTGASAVEYGLLIAGIAAIITAVVFLFGTNMSEMYHNSCDMIYSTTC